MRQRRSVNRGTGGQGIELRKHKSGAPTLLSEGEGNIKACVSARMPRALRSRRPQARQETSCTRTGRPPNYLPTQVEQSGLRRQKPYDRREQIGGVGLRRSTDEPTEQRRVDERGLECGGWGGKGADQGEHRSGPTRTRRNPKKSWTPTISESFCWHFSWVRHWIYQGRRSTALPRRKIVDTHYI